jgi:hypothetical protein
MILVKLSADKVTRWLERKMRRIAQTVAKRGMASTTQSSQANTFNLVSTGTKSNSQGVDSAPVQREACRLALQILTEYAPKTYLEPVVT